MKQVSAPAIYSYEPKTLKPLIYSCRKIYFTLGGKRTFNPRLRQGKSQCIFTPAPSKNTAKSLNNSELLVCPPFGMSAFRMNLFE